MLTKPFISDEGHITRNERLIDLADSPQYLDVDTKDGENRMHPVRHTPVYLPVKKLAIKAPRDTNQAL